MNKALYGDDGPDEFSRPEHLRASMWTAWGLFFDPGKHGHPTPTRVSNKVSRPLTTVLSQPTLCAGTQTGVSGFVDVHIKVKLDEINPKKST